MNKRAFLATAFAGLLALSTQPSWSQEKIGGDINILSWGNYIDFSLPSFEEKYGVKVNIDYYADEQEAMNKIRAAGLGSHDVVFLGAGFEDIAIKQKLIAPLDPARVPTLAEIFPRLQMTKSDGKNYCATYAFGLNGIVTYDPEKTGEEIDSWEQVFSGKYKNRIGKIDKSNEQIWRTALSLGYTYGELTEEQWTKVEERLTENMKQVRTVYAHYDQLAQLLANGEIWVGDSDDGGFRQLKSKGLKVEAGYPKEGLTAWYDGPCIVTDAPNQEAAYAFINHVLSAEVQAQLPKELGYAPANARAMPLLDEQTKVDMGLDGMVAGMDSIQFQYNLGAEFDKRAIEVWERAKASASK